MPSEPTGWWCPACKKSYANNGKPYDALCPCTAMATHDSRKAGWTCCIPEYEPLATPEPTVLEIRPALFTAVDFDPIEDLRVVYVTPDARLGQDDLVHGRRTALARDSEVTDIHWVATGKEVYRERR